MNQEIREKYNELKQSLAEARKIYFSAERDYIESAQKVGKTNVSYEIWKNFIAARDRVEIIEKELRKIIDGAN